MNKNTYIRVINSAIDEVEMTYDELISHVQANKMKFKENEDGISAYESYDLGVCFTTEDNNHVMYINKKFIELIDMCNDDSKLSIVHLVEDIIHDTSNVI